MAIKVMRDLRDFAAVAQYHAEIEIRAHPEAWDDGLGTVAGLTAWLMFQARCTDVGIASALWSTPVAVLRLIDEMDAALHGGEDIAIETNNRLQGVLAKMGLPASREPQQKSPPASFHDGGAEVIQFSDYMRVRK